MTREEAINIMKVIVHMLEEKYDTDRVEEAVDMAIKALEQEPCEDAISRQAVKDMLDARGVKAVMTFEHFKELLDKLPSATPTHKKWIPVSEGATNKDMFKAVFGYEPATDAVVCNKADWCGDSEPCNYCISNPDNIGREEQWWNAPYKAESEV